MTESPSLMMAGGYTSIMPESAIELSGYWRVTRIGRSVGEPLEVNAMLFQYGQDRVVFLQLDVLSAGRCVRDKILAHFRGRLREDQIIVIASHTHYAPGVDNEITQLGPCDERYIDFVTKAACGLLDRILAAAPQPVFLRYGESQAYHSLNRRKWCWAPAKGFPPLRRVIAIQPNFRGARDETVRVLLASSEAGKIDPAGVMWNYTCHAVSTYPADRISSDYPGTTRRLLREQFQRDMPVIFLPGFSGNIRPNYVARFPFHPYALARRIVNGPVFGQFGVESGDAWRSSLGGLVSRLAAFGLRPVEVRGVRSGISTVPLCKFMEGDTYGKTIVCRLARFDPLFAVLCISAEPVVEYVAALQRLCAPQMLIPVGYTGAVAAYLPTSQMLAEGGLEVTSPGYGLENARYRGNISQLVQEEVRKLLASVPAPTDAV